MIMVKLGRRATRIAGPIKDSLSFFSNLQTLLTPEEILEAIIVAHRSRSISQTNDYYLLDYLKYPINNHCNPPANIFGIVTAGIFEYRKFVGTLVNVVGVNKLDEILVRYYPDYIPIKESRVYANYPELLIGEEGSALWYHSHPKRLKI